MGLSIASQYASVADGTIQQERAKLRLNFEAGGAGLLEMLHSPPAVPPQCALVIGPTPSAHPAQRHNTTPPPPAQESFSSNSQLHIMVQHTDPRDSVGLAPVTGPMADAVADESAIRKGAYFSNEESTRSRYKRQSPDVCCPPKPFRFRFLTRNRANPPTAAYATAARAQKARTTEISQATTKALLQPTKQQRTLPRNLRAPTKLYTSRGQLPAVPKTASPPERTIPLSPKATTKIS